jgi:hypothetical protein
VVHRRHADDLLREHVERVARVARRLHEAAGHGAGHRRAGQQIAAELREDHTAARLVHTVARPADPLQAAGDRRRRLDLHHQVDGAHVDPQLQRRRGDQRAQPAGLQQILDLGALGPRQRPVVRAHQWLAGQFIERRRQSFGQPPAVDEEERRPVRPHQLQQLG